MKIIKVNGCHDCEYNDGIGTIARLCRAKDRLVIDDKIRTETIHPDCPLDDYKEPTREIKMSDASEENIELQEHSESGSSIVIRREDLENIKTEINAGSVLVPKTAEDINWNNANTRAIKIIDSYMYGEGLFQK